LNRQAYHKDFAKAKSELSRWKNFARRGGGGHTSRLDSIVIGALASVKVNCKAR
jgi:hypothetical protein